MVLPVKPPGAAARGCRQGVREQAIALRMSKSMCVHAVKVTFLTSPEASRPA